jgi:Arc/MetJ-type ribon-helix-helix transcriptional regulator
VETGRFRSAADVISNALEQMRELETDSQDDLKELREEIAFGMEQSQRGESAPLDLADLKRKAKERAASISSGS